ncbi:MAG: hypothetical protein GTO03_06435, partial [Planctomycetales bacterium]|nr:hypothetical protein [Planctomycetales bacterium]
LAAFQAYIEGVRAREGDDAARAAAIEVQESGFIPGESDLGNEILFQTGLDPLNLLDIGVWRRGIQARRTRAAARMLGAAGV